MIWLIILVVGNIIISGVNLFFTLRKDVILKREEEKKEKSLRLYKNVLHSNFASDAELKSLGILDVPE